MPKRRTRWFAVVLRWLIRGLKARLKTRCVVATRLATARGEEIAQFLGTSSPTTIRTTVEIAVPRIRAAEEAVPADRPIASKGPWSRAEIDGLEIMPMTRPVTVMPSWAPESWNVRVRTAARALSAPRSPRSTARSSSLRSTVVSENSAATKTPQARQSSSATTSRSTSVIDRSPPSQDRPGGGVPRDVANAYVVDWEARPWADAHTFHSRGTFHHMVKEEQRERIILLAERARMMGFGHD